MTAIEPTMTIRAGGPNFLDLEWTQSITEWPPDRLLDLPKGISRHEVRFVAYEDGIYAIKELPLRPARKEWENLRVLEELGAAAVKPVGIVERIGADPGEEWAAAVITRYLDHSFSYRELLQGPGFGDRRNQLLDAFAALLVELHILGVFWGDCSLSNVLYGYDAEGIRTTLVDSETSDIHPEGLTDGQRLFDIDIMETNVAGGMADIAAQEGIDLDEADLDLGEDIAGRYHGLWRELHETEKISPNERYRITEKVRALNELGFEVEDVSLAPDQSGELRFSFRVGSRRFHTNRLRELTGIDATENQARQILTDLYRHLTPDTTSTNKALRSVQWRIGHFEPMIQQIAALPPNAGDPVQAYCDFLHHRYLMSAGAGYDVPDDVAYADWIERGQPGFDLPVSDA